MSRRASRFGFRLLAIGLLVLSLAGGYFIASHRQVQRQQLATELAGMTEANQMREFKIYAAQESGAVSAQADAQAKADAAAAFAASQAKAADDAARRDAASRSKTRPTPTSSPVDIPSSCNQYSGNRAIGCALMLAAGFGLDQAPCLINIWNKESGWNPKAVNPSGATGIPQALPASKMAAYGSDYLTNPATQIKWGLNYIKTRYTSPCGAWSFWQAHGWY